MQSYNISTFTSICVIAIHSRVLVIANQHKRPLPRAGTSENALNWRACPVIHPLAFCIVKVPQMHTTVSASCNQTYSISLYSPTLSFCYSLLSSNFYFLTIAKHLHENIVFTFQSLSLSIHLFHFPHSFLSPSFGRFRLSRRQSAVYERPRTLSMSWAVVQT